MDVLSMGRWWGLLREDVRQALERNPGCELSATEADAVLSAAGERATGVLMASANSDFDYWWSLTPDASEWIRSQSRR